MTVEDDGARLVAEKQHAREQWSKDPCGARYGAKYEFATREFFDEVERHRYQEYAPWMPSVMGFNDFKGKRLLEVGCGMGTDLLQFARGGASCTGVDLTPRSVEISSLHLGLYGLRADFALCDGERLPFADESFDVVYSNGVLHHTPDTAQAVREVHRVLRPGGLARVMLYHRNSLYYWTEIILHRGLLRGHFLRGHSPEEIMSRYVEYSSAEARPLVKVYSRRQALSLFEPFREVKTEIEQMIHEELRFLRPLVSEKMFDRLRRSAGWNVIISARK
ncbi:MAG TPA: class I SAM-dependent methyltransferase [Pyrinomonadaceae bacterium]|nr:class I SAM-dependent methyltransferase [Pyrinomonadaceae bacterium]